MAAYRDKAGQPGILAADLRLTDADLDRLLRPEGESLQAAAHWPGLLLAQRLESRVLDEVLAQVLPRITVGIAMPVGSLLRQIGVQRAALVPCGQLSFLPLAAAPLTPRTGAGTSPGPVPLAVKALAYRGQPDLRARLLRAAHHPVGAGRRSRRDGGPRWPPLPRGRGQPGGGAAAAVGGGRGAKDGQAGRRRACAAHRRQRQKASRKDGPHAAADVVHLACHGVFNPLSLDRSRLVLADGGLPLPQIMASAAFRGVRLVVAAACETASTDLRLPDEPTGMASAFLQAGAAAVLGALWQVHDLPASLLASRVAAACCDPTADPATELALAQAWLRDLDAASAVRAARELLAEADLADRERLRDDIAYLEKSGITHPFSAPSHWAPYVLVSGPG